MMKGLPKTFDLSPFVGRTVDEVSFTVNTVSFNFDADLVLTVEGPVEHSPALGTTALAVGEPPFSESRLMQLAGHQVTSATVEDDGGLSLFFEDGQSLRCMRGPEPYECFQIRHGGQEIVA